MNTREGSFEKSSGPELLLERLYGALRVRIDSEIDTWIEGGRKIDPEILKKNIISEIPDMLKNFGLGEGERKAAEDYVNSNIDFRITKMIEGGGERGNIERG